MLTNDTGITDLYGKQPPIFEIWHIYLTGGFYTAFWLLEL